MLSIQPRIESLTDKLLVGKSLRMSLTDNKTHMLWQSFMPMRRTIPNTLSSDMFSLQVYDEPVRVGDLKQEFVKWAAIEVADISNIPQGMELLHLKGGLYAVFPYKGLNTDVSIFIYIFGTWLPDSDYELDHRPHFEILGEKYRNNDPDSEEDIWIPVRRK